MIIDDDLLTAIIKNAFIITKLPTSKRTAISTQDLGIKCDIPQTTIYRRLSPLFDWDNLGQFKKPRRGGRPEMYFYLKNNFTIEFENGKISIVYYGETL